MNLFVLLLVMLSFAPAGVRAQAQPANAPIGKDGASTTGVVAVVNDAVITRFELDQRIKLAIANTGLPDTPQTRQRLQPQVLDSLVDEKLELQEARRLKIPITRGEVESAIKSLEKRNGMAPGDLNKVLSRAGINRSALEDQITAQIAWSRVVGEELRSHVHIGANEVDRTLAELKVNMTKPVSRVAEIFLAVPSAALEGRVRQNALNIVDQLRHGAGFPALAAQFSQNNSAQQGGDLGWVHQGELSHELDEALAKLQPGEITQEPVRAADGYHVLLLRERRDPNTPEVYLDLHQLFLPLPNTPTEDQARPVIAALRAAAEKVKSCADLPRVHDEIHSPVATAIGQINAASLNPPELRNLLMNLPDNKLSPVLRVPNGLAELIVCRRQTVKPQPPTRASVEESLVVQRLEVMAQHYLRDLRQQGTVDIRV